MPTLTAFKIKLLKPGKSLLRLLKHSNRRSISIPALKFQNLQRVRKEKEKRCRRRRRRRRQRRRFRSLVSVFQPFKRSGEAMDRVMELKSFTERDQAPFPSPLTPAFIKLIRARHLEDQGGEDVEEACRSFENYLVEMIAEEGKVRDLTDVEELLFCCNCLKSPVFVDLVSRFYGELCKDLFSGNNQYEVLDDSTYEC